MASGRSFPEQAPTISQPQRLVMERLEAGQSIEEAVKGVWLGASKVLRALVRKEWVTVESVVTDAGREALKLPTKLVVKVAPTRRSMMRLRNQKALVAKVERWNSFAKVNMDVWGFADIITVQPDQPGTLFIQACAHSNVHTRLKKMCGPKIAPRIRKVLEAGNRVEIWTWGLDFTKTHGKRAVYTLRVRPLTLADVAPGARDGLVGVVAAGLPEGEEMEEKRC